MPKCIDDIYTSNIAVGSLVDRGGDLILANGKFYATYNKLLNLDGTSNWDSNEGYIKEFNLDGSWTGNIYPFIEADHIRGICWDGEFFLAGGWTTKRIYKFSKDWVYTDTYYDLSILDCKPWGIATNGEFLWVSNEDYTIIHKLTMDGVSTGVSFTVNDGFRIRGLMVYDDHLWFSDWETGSIYKYTLDGVYTGYTIELYSDIKRPTGLHIDKDYIWVYDWYSTKVFKLNWDGTLANTTSQLEFGKSYISNGDIDYTLSDVTIGTDLEINVVSGNPIIINNDYTISGEFGICYPGDNLILNEGDVCTLLCTSDNTIAII